AGSTFNLTNTGNMIVNSNISSGSGGITLTDLGGYSIYFPNSVTLTGNTTLNDSSGAIQAANSTTINSTGTFAINAGAVINLSSFTQTSGSPTFTINSNSGLGTIFQSGDLTLTPNLIINSFGKNLSIIAQGNVLTSGSPQINLSGPTGRGGTLTIV